MKHRFLLLAVVAIAFTVGRAQNMDRSPAPPPKPLPALNQHPDAQWDLQFDYDATTVTGAAGNAGALFFDNAAAGGKQFWTSRWASNVLHRWNVNGTLIEQFTITGVTGVRGMTYDGQYIYASSNSATIYKIDPVTKTLVSTITCQSPVTTRVIVYDPVRDGFWVSNFADNLSCVNRSGSVIATIPATQLVAKYGGAYDRYTPGGPYMWIWDQTNTAGGTPQPVYQVNLNTLAFTGTTFDILTRVTTGGATPIAGGLFIATGIVPGKVTIGGLLQGVPDRLWGLELATSAADTVLPFNLQTPAPGTKITTLPGSTTPVTVSWDTNRVGVTFKWIFGAPVVPPRLITIPSSTNSYTTTLGALDAVLASLGLQQGDSVIGQWDVWAFRNNPTNDSLKSTNGPRALTLKRGRPTLGPFNLVSPASGTTVTTSAFVTTPINFIWRKSGDGVSYRWKFATPTFTGTIRFNVSTALDTMASFRSSQLDSMVATLGVQPGDSISGQWRAYAYSGTDSLVSAQTFDVKFKRAALPPCLSDYQVTRQTGITFTSISTTGTSFSGWRNTTSIDDNRSNSTPIGFTFNYIGQDYTSFSASTNGFLDFSSSAATGSGTAAYGYQNTQFTATTGTLLALGPMYEDLIFPTGTLQTDMMKYKLDGTAPNRVLTVEWIGVRQFASSGAGSMNFQVKLYESPAGKIEFVYGPMDPGTGTLTYTLGLNGPTMSATPTFCELLTQQTANTATFGFIPQNSLATAPESNTKLTFTVRTTSVPTDPVGVPTQFALLQNYPNPFNPTTTIRYTLPEQANVTLKVFNLLGQEVVTLANEVQNASFHSVVWDGRNAAGQQVSTGVYFYQLEATSVGGKNHFADMKKMLLIK